MPAAEYLDVRILDQSELLLGLVELFLLPPDVGLRIYVHCSNWPLMVWNMLNCAGGAGGFCKRSQAEAAVRGHSARSQELLCEVTATVRGHIVAAWHHGCLAEPWHKELLKQGGRSWHSHGASFCHLLAWSGSGLWHGHVQGFMGTS